jgi:hypothetical protein
MTERDFDGQVQLNYLQIAEVQRRGLVHVHAVFRLDGPDGPDLPAPPWTTTESFVLSMQHVIRETKVVGVDGSTYKWGSQFDIQLLVNATEDGRKTTAYLAKYATKTTDDGLNYARQFSSRRQITKLPGNAHLRRFALQSWDIGSETNLESLKLKEHANTLGFRSHLITKSRNYSTTFKELRRARADYQSHLSSLDPVEGSFHYDGRGYRDPKASELAEVMFTMQRDLNKEKAERKRAEREISEAKAPETPDLGPSEQDGTL